MAAKAYQLVVQLSTEHVGSFDAVIAFEQRLIVALPRTHTVDGHDIGAGTVNFFIDTDAPVAAYKAIRRICTRVTERWMRIAYRLSSGKDFVTLWPHRDPRPFDYQYDQSHNPFTPASKRAIPKRSPRGTRAI